MYEHLCIGREQQLARLASFLEQALAGQGQICFVTGEAGSGKSTLVHEISRRAEKAHPELISTLGVCNAQSGQGDPYLPFREILALLTGDVDKKLAEGAISPENANRLRKFVIRSVQTILDVGPDLVNVLVPGGGVLVKFGTAVADRAGWLEKLEKAAKKKPSLPGLSELSMDQSHVFEQLARVFNTLAREKPLLLLLDDLHWADTSSINLLFHLARSITNSRILIVGAYRPEEVARGRLGTRHPLEDIINELRRYSGEIRIPLDESDETDRRQFIDLLLDSEPNTFDERFRQVLFQHTGGQALFTVEILNELASRGSIQHDAQGRWFAGQDLDWESLPARVEGVIEQRIGRLDDELQAILTAASVEGARFTAEAIAKAQSQEPRRLIGRMSNELDKRDRLIRAIGVQRIGNARLSRYQFLHNLYQVYLYDRLDEIQRVYLHESLALALEELYGAQAGEIAGELARHFDQAGWIEKAIQYRLEAANQAIWSSAYLEASDHLHAGLKLLQRQPDLPESPRYELQLQAALAPTLVALQGWGVPAAQQAYDRACLLSQRLGERQFLSSLIHGLGTLHEFRGEYERSKELMEQRLELLSRTDEDPHQVVETYELLSCSTFHQGMFAASLEHVDQGLEMFDFTTLPVPVSRFHGEDPGISCLTWRALNLWFLGYPDQAWQQMQQALDLANQVMTVYTQATVLCRAATLRMLRGEPSLVLKLTAQSAAITSETRYPYFRAAAMILQGWATIASQTDHPLAALASGQAVMPEQSPADNALDSAISGIQQGLAIHARAGAHMDRPFFLALLADARRMVGQSDLALADLQSAIDQVRRSRSFFYEAELYRLQGEVLLAQDPLANQPAAEAAFQQALQTAACHSSPSLQLRAAASLARLYEEQGKAGEASSLLSELYATFTEGFATADLLQAKALHTKLT